MTCCCERKEKVSLLPCTKSCSSWISSFVRGKNHLWICTEYHFIQDWTIQWLLWGADQINIKLKRIVFIRFFLLLISSFWWKYHTKSWQKLGNVNQVKPDQILSQAASLNIRSEGGEGGYSPLAGSDKLLGYEPVLANNPLNGPSLQCLESDIKCPAPQFCVEHIDIPGVLRPPRGAMMDFMSHISLVRGYLE